LPFDTQWHGQYLGDGSAMGTSCGVGDARRHKPPPINAKAETVAKLPMFRDSYRKRRCILPIDAFFEWKAVLGSKVK
jgi:putative SOS response-associated peptidase YedK